MTDASPEDLRRADDFLMPFGSLSPRVVLDAQHYAALRRAAAKLETLQSGRGFVPAGTNHSLLLYNLAKIAVVVIPFSGLALLCAALGFIPGSLFFTILVIVALCTMLPSIRAASLKSPVAAVACYYDLLAAARFNRALERVVRCDRDDFPMRPHEIPALGEAGDAATHLDEQSFAQYWTALFNVQSSPWVQIRTHSFATTDLGAGLHGVEFNIEIIVRSRHWLWLTLLAVVPGYALALILSYWTSVRVRGRLHKLVYKMAGECQLFNAEFQGAEEFDLSWLRVAEAPAELSKSLSA